MLSRKPEMCVNAVVHAAVDRGRVAERLRAAFAGLHELQHLRVKQGDMVQRALRMDTDTDTESEHAGSDVCLNQSNEDANTFDEQQRLEATLTALKQQLTRLRRQDVGLKTHLQQLDQQISELKLDACKASAEHLESDSRPSSGFFELSDGGLGSLSNSCTSVYSECLSTTSQVSLLPLSSGFSAGHGRNAQLQADVSRRRSADETTSQSDVPRGLGIRLGSSGIRTGSVSSEKARQRPVSTGDLDRVINPGFGYYKPFDVKTSKTCDPTVDPKYQSNLVSRNGSEVYCYPSPLHAVALQSPIFSLSGDKSGPLASNEQEKHIKVGLSKDTLPKQDPSDTKAEGYIFKLLQRSSSKMSLQSEVGVENGLIPNNATQDHEFFGFRMKQMNDYEVQGPLLSKTESTENLVKVEMKSPPRPAVKDQINPNNIQAEEYRQRCPAQYSPSAQNQTATAVMDQAKMNENETRDRSDPENSLRDASAVGKTPEGKPSFTFPNEKNNIRDRSCTHVAKSEFVCAQFVPAGSQRIKVHQASKKTKSVKLRKKGNEKSTGKKQHLKHSFRDHGKDKVNNTKTRIDRNPKQFSTEREWIEAPLIEPRLCSCSCESSLLGPGNQHGTHLQSFRQQKHASKATKHPKGQFSDLENPSRKRQTSQKWSVAPEMQVPVAPATHFQRFGEVPNYRISQRPGMVRSSSMRPRSLVSGHWTGLSRPLQPSRSSSYFSNMNVKYPPAPVATHYPPRCESEYSAECASLFHSTIVESSDGELSDYTTNRFGDSESSQESQTGSDSDSSLSLDDDDLYEEDENEGGLVWAEATVGPTANGMSIQQHLRPEPASCRIKASRALKKKIRRFQPASLKVMTLV